MNFSTVCVIGLGYIGLPTASTFATHGLHVIGVDSNPHVVTTLRNGDIHIQEPGLRSLVQTALGSGKLHICDTPQEADAFIIAVPTPFDEHKHAELRAVVNACEAIMPVLRRGNLVVLESTSPPRTTCDIVKPILEKSGLKCGKDFLLAYVPERVLPGQILEELIENARVIGGYDHASAKAGRDLYQIFVHGEIFLTDATTAEMVKLMENTSRDINIAIANEFCRLADRFGVDVWEAIAIANRHPRVKILKPGIGVGGHCIGVDPWFLVEAAQDITPLIQAARQVNDTQPSVVVALIKKAVNNVTNLKLGILGLTYKPDVDDLRESPAIEILKLLLDEGMHVIAFDPYRPTARLAGVSIATSLDEVLKEANLLALLVAHTDFKNLDPQLVKNQTSARIVVDAVNGWNCADWQRAGFRFLRLGDGKTNRFS